MSNPNAKTMLINTVEGHECRIAILKGGRLEELYTERNSSASQVGSIYKGRVTNIEPSIQAAFVDFGGPKNGFLHISDVHPRFFPRHRRNTEAVGRRTAHRTRPPIQECLRRGQEIVVQMTKQGIGTKGPTLTTYLSIPGRLIVMMPDMTHVGISRKIEDEEARQKLRKVLDQLDIPKDMGVIVRTAGVDRPKRELQRDLSYLTRLWKAVQDRIAQTRAPAEIYQESDLVIRTIRDVFDSSVERIICDTESVALRVQEFLDVAVPRARCRIDFYTGRRGLFEEFGVEEEIRRIHSRHVQLPNGGSLVFDQAEALVAIDVNSGSFRAHSNAEVNALNLNLAAAEEIARQLRLRDLGGVIIIDFVDMREEKNRRTLEKKMRDLLKQDRAKSKILRISNFGILEMTRQRLKPSLKQSLFSRCPHCDGTGLVMSRESAALAVLRTLQSACASDEVAVLEVSVAPNVAQHLLNVQRQMLADLERQSGKTITVHADETISENDVQIRCTNARGAAVAWERSLREKEHRDETLFRNIRDSMNAAAEPEESEEDLFEEGKEPSESATPAGPEAFSAEPPSAESVEALCETVSPPRRSRRGGRRRRKKSALPAESVGTSGAEAPQADPGDVSPETRAEIIVPDVVGETAASPDYPPSFPTNGAAAGSAAIPALPAGGEPPFPAGEGASEPGAPGETKKKSRRRGKRGGRRHRKKNRPADDPSALPPREPPTA